MRDFDRATTIAHPEWIDDAVANMHRNLALDMKLPGMPLRAFLLSTPAHRLLRGLYGGYWAVAWWAIRKAMVHTFNSAMPQWWHEWRYRRLCAAEEDTTP